MRCHLSQVSRMDHRRLPCQVCYAEKTTDTGHWKFKAVDWRPNGYEAQVVYNGHYILSEKEIPTRLKAQKRAEEMLDEFCKAVLKEGVTS